MILRLRGIASSASYAAVDMFLSSFLVGSVDANAMYMFSSNESFLKVTAVQWGGDEVNRARSSRLNNSHGHVC